LGEHPENFIQTIEREVNQNPNQFKRKIEKWKVEVLKLQTTCASLLVLAPQSVIPDEVWKTILTVMIVVFLVGIAIGTICLMLAGIWKTLRQDSSAWTRDILKGIGQVVLAPVIVALIVIICAYLFGNLPVYKPFKEAIDVYLHNL
jgi:hypothetical protein